MGSVKVRFLDGLDLVAVNIDGDCALDSFYANHQGGLPRTGDQNSFESSQTATTNSNSLPHLQAGIHHHRYFGAQQHADVVDLLGVDRRKLGSSADDSYHAVGLYDSESFG